MCLSKSSKCEDTHEHGNIQRKNTEGSRINLPCNYTLLESCSAEKSRVVTSSIMWFFGIGKTVLTKYVVPKVTMIVFEMLFVDIEHIDYLLMAQKILHV